MVRISVAAAFLAFTTSAHAGARRTQRVVIDTVARTAVGAVGSARNNTDPNEAIWCWVLNNTGGCNAVGRNANGAYVNMSCTTSDPRMLATMRSVHGFSHISFGLASGGSSSCHFLTVTQSSEYEPAIP